MKRKRLDNQICGIQDIINTIKEMKEEFKDYTTQIEVIEIQTLKDCYTVTLWEVR